MSKQSMREETERLIREAMERKALVIKEGKTRIEARPAANAGPPTACPRRAEPAAQPSSASNAD
jgi:hypothetical protein